MERIKKYKIAILIVSFLLVIESAALIFVLTSRPHRPKPKAAIPFKGKIAIVIDDWGYNQHNLHILEGIKYPITAAILPRLSYSDVVMEELHRLGFQIILHLPMEPREKYRLERNTVMTFMNEETIQDIIDEDLKEIHYAVGVSNHQGSKATEDVKTMKIVLNELKKRNLFFLDSFVSPKSICLALAPKLRIGFAKRDIFLDNKDDPEYIKSQIYKLKKIARATGAAIGIGHDRKVTLEVLKQVMPQLKKEGYKFVFVSELVK